MTAHFRDVPAIDALRSLCVQAHVRAVKRGQMVTVEAEAGHEGLEPGHVELSTGDLDGLEDRVEQGDAVVKAGGRVRDLVALSGKATELKRAMPLYWRLDMAPPREKVTMAMRDGDFKVLASRDLSTVEIYNLKADPGEKDNLATKDSTRLAAMRDRLKAFNGQVEAEGPDWWRTEPTNGREKKPAGQAKPRRTDAA